MSDYVIECAGVTQVYNVSRGGREHRVRAVDEVSFKIRRGQTLGLVGESGSGKSTLGLIAAALLQPSSGQVLVSGQPVGNPNRKDRRLLRRRVQIVWQDPLASMNEFDRIEVVVTEAPISHGLFPRAERREHAERILASVGLPADVAEKRPPELSGGQLQRIAIARAIALEPEILICDEVTSALDVSVQAQILNLLHEVQKRTSVAFLFISHNLQVVRHISDEVAVMYAGRIVETGPTNRVYASPQHPYSKVLVSTAKANDFGASEMQTSTTDRNQGCAYRQICPVRKPVCENVKPPLTPRKNGTFAACHVHPVP
jgi:peptide/nickel transport system ATP-binding protein